MQWTMGHILPASASSLTGMAFAGSAHAQAFYLQAQSVRAQGRAFSGEAADRGVDSLRWNPAAIAGMEGGEAAVRASAILPRGKVSDSGIIIVRPGSAPAPVGGDPVERNPVSNDVLPSGAVVYGFGRLALGLAFSGPYNFTTDYAADSWARYTADRTKLRTIDIQPTVALAVTSAAQNGSVDITASFRTPWMAIGDIRYAVTPQFTLNGQVVRHGWGKFDAIDLGAPVNASVPEDYRNSWSYATGVDYAVNPAWTVRAGVEFVETPTQDGSRDAAVPDSDRWNFSAGTSYALSKSITLDAAASYVAFKHASIDRPTAAYAGTPAQTPILVDGTLTDASALVFSLGARMTF